MDAKRILFINTETAPYQADNEVSAMGKKLPETMQSAGYEIRTFMPKWGNINERRGQLHEVIRLSGMNIIIDDTDHPLLIKVASIPVSRVQVYFIDNEDYFSRRGIIADADGNDYADNFERAIFFARGVLETVMKLRWKPDIIHCQGWMASVVPLFLKVAYNEEPCFQDVKIVTSYMGSGLSNHSDDRFKRCLEFRGVNAEVLKEYKEDFDIVELAKLACDYSDGVIMGSAGVNAEVVSYAEKSGKPFVAYEDAPFKDKYIELYKAL